MISIRSYRNSDTPDLLRLWNKHRESAGIHPPLTMAALEIVVLSRPYFQRNHLLVAADDRRTVGFLHWLPIAGDLRRAVVANIALPEHPQQTEIAQQLFDRATEEAQASGISRLLIGNAPEYWTGYAGVGRSGMGGGVLDADEKVSRWAQLAGFQPRRKLLTFGLALQSYRPAFDREQLAMRRAATVDRRRDINDQPFRIASAMSHLEMHRFVASERSGKRLAELELLLGDPEMSIVSGGTVLLSRWAAASDPPPPNPTAALRFVLSGAIAEMASERAEQIQTTIEADDQAAQALLESVGFSLQYSGTVYARELT